MLPNSDCDLVIVTDESKWPDSDAARQLHAEIWQQLEPLGMVRPKPDGIFSETVTWGQLTDRSTLGLVDEDQSVYGKRMQMLLDSQPVAGEGEFQKLQFEVLKRFHRPLVNNPYVCDWTPLINEVVRYWKALEVRTAWIDDPGQWRYLNVKLRHSRQLIIAGLLRMLCRTTDVCGQLHASGAFRGIRSALSTAVEVGFLQNLLTYTPIERTNRGDGLMLGKEVFETLNYCYELFLKRMAEEEFVARLGDPAIKELNTPEYLELRGNAIRFSDAINLILRQQAEKCPPHVRQALMLP
jgi:hypothetical protein